MHGAYQDEDLPGLLAWLQPDIAWFPAQWPETYSYTLSAALQAGLPVAVPDIGAFAERVADRPWSWVCPWGQDGRGWTHFFSTIRTQHFAPAVPPGLPAAQQHVPDAPHWNYQSNYLKDLPPAPPTVDTPPLTVAALAAFQAQPTAAEGARSGTLSALVYLRSLPLLRDVARAIPAPWQRRVKMWLRG